MPVDVRGDQITVIGDGNSNETHLPAGDAGTGDGDGDATGDATGEGETDGDGDGDGGESGGDDVALPGEGLAPGQRGDGLTSATPGAAVPGAVDAGLGQTATERGAGSPLLPAGLLLLGLLCLGGAVRARKVST